MLRNIKISISFRLPLPQSKMHLWRLIKFLQNKIWISNLIWTAARFSENNTFVVELRENETNSNETMKSELVKDGKLVVSDLRPGIAYTVKLGVRENPTSLNTTNWKWSQDFTTKRMYLVY